MGSYYPSSTTHIDVLSTPYTNGQKFASDQESNLVHGNMMVYLNPTSSNGSFSDLSSNPSMNPHNGENFSSMSGRNEMMFIPPTSNSVAIQAMSSPLNQETVKNVGNSITGELRFIPRNNIGMMEGDQTLEGLSLSLNTQMSTPSFQYQYPNPGISSVLDSNRVRQMSCKVDETSPSKVMRDSDYFANDNTIRFGFPNENSQFLMNPKGVNCSQYQYEQASVASALVKSKYLKVNEHEMGLAVPAV